VAYELLFRHSADTTRTNDGDLRLAHVFLSPLSNMDASCCWEQASIHQHSRAHVDKRPLELLPAKRVVLEVLEQSIHTELLARITA
jgi:c-di-GMP-related signal transduction protein